MATRMRCRCQTENRTPESTDTQTEKHIGLQAFSLLYVIIFLLSDLKTLAWEGLKNSIGFVIKSKM